MADVSVLESISIADSPSVNVVVVEVSTLNPEVVFVYQEPPPETTLTITSVSTLNAEVVYSVQGAVPPDAPPVAGAGPSPSGSSPGTQVVSGTRPGGGKASGGSGGSKSSGESSRTVGPKTLADYTGLSTVDGTIGYVQWRAYVGPPWRVSTASDFYDWSALSTGVYTPVPAATTLAVSADYNDSTITLTDASAFPSAGGAWIGPNGTGQSWGYVTWTGKSSNDLTGITWDAVDAEYTGVHTAGASFVFWWSLSTATNNPVLTETMDGNNLVITWNMTLGGIVAPTPALRPNHLVIFQIRNYDTGTDTWDSWETLCLGWISQIMGSDDYNRKSEWSITVTDISGPLNQEQAPGLQVGVSPLSAQGSVTVSSTLEPVYKEANTGEFVSSSEDVSGDQVIDGEDDTLWISDGFVGEANTYSPSGSHATGDSDLYLSQLHATKYSGQSNGYRWFELSTTSIAGWDQQVYVILNYDYLLDLGNVEVSWDADNSKSKSVIVAENPTLFQQENPNHEAATILDLADFQVQLVAQKRFLLDLKGSTSGQYTLELDKVGDAYAPQKTGYLLWNSSAQDIEDAIVAGAPDTGTDDCRVEDNGDGTFTIRFINARGEFPIKGSGDGGFDTVAITDSNLAGGSGTPDITDTTPTGAYYAGTTFFDNLDLTGGMIRIYWGVAGQGQSQFVWGDFRTMTVWAPVWVGNASAAISGEGTTYRIFFNPADTTQSTNFWLQGRTATPGYIIQTGDIEWLQIDLPVIDKYLNDALTAVYTGTITLKDTEGANVEGLPSSGTIQVGLEQMTYDSRNFGDGTINILARAQNSTTAAAHSAGDKVYYVDSGVATEAYPVSEIIITRPTGFSILEDFVIRGSKLSTARTPDQDNYTTDYSTLATVTGNALEEYTLDLSATDPRVRFLLIEISAMSEAPSRVKINEVTANVDTSILDTSKFIESGDTYEIVEALLETLIGVPSAAIIDGTGNLTVSNFVTEKDLSWAIVADLADFISARVTVGRNSKITIAPDPYSLEAVSYTETAEFDRDDIGVISYNKSPNRSVGQLEVTWRLPTDQSENVLRYPATITSGRIMSSGPHIFNNSTVATTATQRRYWSQRVGYSLVADMATERYTVRPGAFYGATWDLNAEDLSLNRTYMIIGASHGIVNYGWQTVLTLLQIGREDEI